MLFWAPRQALLSLCVFFFFLSIWNIQPPRVPGTLLNVMNWVSSKTFPECRCTANFPRAGPLKTGRRQSWWLVENSLSDSSFCNYYSPFVTVKMISFLPLLHEEMGMGYSWRGMIHLWKNPKWVNICFPLSFIEI